MFIPSTFMVGCQFWHHTRNVCLDLRILATVTLGAVTLSVSLAHAQNSTTLQPPPEKARTHVSPSDTVVLSLHLVHELVVQQNPTYLGARQTISASQGALKQSRLYRFNPDLGVQSPGSGRNASPYQMTLTQEIEWAGQRGLRVNAARSEVTRSEADARDVGRRLLADASRAYYRAMTTTERRRVAEEQIALTKRLLAAVRIQAQEGEISAFESSLAEIEGARSQSRLLAARREATQAMLELTRLIGFTPGIPIRVMDIPTSESESAPPSPPNLRETDSLIALALLRRPDIAAARAEIREANLLTSLARREALPNLRLGALAERDRGGAGRTRIGATLGMTLPLLNRNQGLRDQRAAEVQRARFASRETELLVRAEVTDAIRAYETANEEVMIFQTSILIPAKENSKRLETAYTAGKIDIATLLLLRNQLLEAELSYWDAWLTRQNAWVQLDAAVGTLDPNTLPLSNSSSTAHAVRNTR